MKITVGRLKTIIQEELNEYGMSMKNKRKGKGMPSYKRDEDEESPKEELGSDAYAESAEQTEVILDDLKEVLKKWEEAEYDSDEERWQAYAKDVQGLIDQYEGEEEPEEHTEEECEEVHPEQSHEEWEAEQEGHREEGEEEEEGEEPKKKSEKKESKPSSGSKPSAPKLAKMTYESKKKRLNSELVGMIKEQLTSLKRG